MAETLRMSKMGKWTTLPALLVLTGVLWGQTAPPPVYVESFRKGRVQISESNLLANLTLESPSYSAVIKDPAGNGRYQLLIEPRRVSEQFEQVMGWQVRLIDVKRKYLGKPAGKHVSQQSIDRPAAVQPCLVAGSEPICSGAAHGRTGHQGGRFLLRSSGEGNALYKAGVETIGFDAG